MVLDQSCDRRASRVLQTHGDPPRDRRELLVFHHRLLSTRRPGTRRLPSDAVVQVGDTRLPLDDPGALQLDVLGSEVVKRGGALGRGAPG